MIDPADPRLAFDVRNWVPSVIDAPYVDQEAYSSLRSLAVTKTNSRQELLSLGARAREASPGNGIVDYLMANKILEMGETRDVLQLLEAGNSASVHYCPVSIPMPMGHLDWTGRVRRLASFPIYWNLERGERRDQEPLALPMLRRFALCAPATYVKVLLAIACLVATCREAGRRDFNRLRLARNLARIVKLRSVKSTVKARQEIWQMRGKSLSQVEKEFREAFNEIGGLSDGEFRLILAGKRVEDPSRMKLIEDWARRDYEDEHAETTVWLRELGPLVDDVAGTI